MIDQNLTILFCVNISSILTRSPTALAKTCPNHDRASGIPQPFLLFAFLKNCCLIICESAEGPRASVRAFLRIWQHTFIYIWLVFFVCLFFKQTLLFCCPLFQFALIKKNFEKRTFSDSILIMEKWENLLKIYFNSIKLFFLVIFPY